MLLYRAIEFDKLFHLTDTFYSYQFTKAIEETRKKKNSDNWWYLDSVEKYNDLKKQIFLNIYDKGSSLPAPRRHSL